AVTMTGAVVSRTVTMNDAVAASPDSFVAVHRTVVAPMGKIEPDAGEQVTGAFPYTASVADAANVALAPFGPVASTVRFGRAPMTGGVASLTVTWNVAEARLPCESATEHVTTLLPSANVDPDAGEQLTARLPSTRSAAVGIG